MITTVLLDLDGVVRHFNPAHRAAIEEQHGLEAGALLTAAFAPELLTPALVGEITHSDWVERIGHRIDNLVAAHEWTADRGFVDAEILGVVEALRAEGIAVVILTNGTSLIPSDMSQLGLVECFDAVFNSAEIGFAKPDVRVFKHVCETLAVAPQQVFFTDDSASKLGGAIELGITSRQFTSVAAFKADLRDLGII